MKVGLFIPCYIEAFFPEVGVATLELLERLAAMTPPKPQEATAAAPSQGARALSGGA